MVVTLGQQYNVGEKPVILYTYNNRRAGTPGKTQTKDTTSLDGAHVFSVVESGSEGCQHYFITILLAIKKLQIDKAEDKV